MAIKNNFIRKNAFEIVAAFAWVLIISFYFYYKSIHNLTDSEILKKIYVFISGEGYYAGLIYILIYVLRTIILFPASLLILLSASLFGIPFALVYTIIGENLSGILGYSLGRFYGTNIISDSMIEKYSHLKTSLSEDAFITTLTLRMIFLPFDPICYMSGFFKTNFKGYFWGTLFGTFPGILIFVLVGASIKNVEKFDFNHIVIEQKYFLWSLMIIISSLTIVYFIRKKNKSA